MTSRILSPVSQLMQMSLCRSMSFSSIGRKFSSRKKYLSVFGGGITATVFAIHFWQTTKPVYAYQSKLPPKVT